MPKVARTFLVLLVVLFSSSGFAQESFDKVAVINRLTHITVSVETQAPVLSKPVFVVPAGAKLLESYLKTTYTERYNCELELIIYFEKSGSYSIGPFVFADKEGNSYTAKPVKIQVLGNEVLQIPAKATKSQLNPLKFYTLKPQDTLYNGSFIYFVLEIPAGYEKVELIWPGWEDVYTERLPDVVQKNEHYEAKFLVFFNKDGKFNLSPLKIKVKKGEQEQLFSSSALNFDVKKVPEELELLGLGDGNIKSTVYTTTQKNYVQLDIVFSGTGNLYNLKPPKISISPAGDLLLKKVSYNFLEQYPEIKGQVKFSYIFFPHQDGIYQVKVNDFKMFEPKSATFKYISGLATAINVMLPSNPQSSEYKDTLKDKLNIRTRPDYDFYALIIALLFVTVIAIALYLRTLKKTKKHKVKVRNFRTTDPFFVVQQAVLTYLKFFTGVDVKPLALSQIKEKIRESSMSEELKREIADWLNESFKLRYLDKTRAGKKELLKQEGLALLRKMKMERQKMIKLTKNI